MGLFDIFKRKPGGTILGNLFRGVAKAATGGVLGNGAMMISEQDADKRNLDDAAYFQKYGDTKDGSPPSDDTKKKLGIGEYAKAAIDAAAGAIGKELGKEVKATAWELFKLWFKKNWWMIVLPGGLVIGGLSWLIFRKKKTRRAW